MFISRQFYLTILVYFGDKRDWITKVSGLRGREVFSVISKQ